MPKQLITVLIKIAYIRRRVLTFAADFYKNLIFLLKNITFAYIILPIGNFEMKFAGKDILSTEGVKLSGAVVCSATVNGSTLWRHPDQPGAEGATYEFLV